MHMTKIGTSMNKTLADHNSMRIHPIELLLFAYEKAKAYVIDRYPWYKDRASQFEESLV